MFDSILVVRRDSRDRYGEDVYDPRRSGDPRDRDARDRDTDLVVVAPPVFDAALGRRRGCETTAATDAGRGTCR